MANPLADDLAAEVARLIDEGEEFADAGEDADALACFRAAWDLLPEPKVGCPQAAQVVAAVADSHFHLGEYDECRRVVQRAVRGGVAAADHPFLRLRLGQCLFETGELPGARDLLVPAYLAAGEWLFDGEEAKYLAFVKEGL